VLAPEQKMLNSSEFADRMSYFNSRLQDETLLNDAGCEVELFQSAQATSDEKLLDIMNERFFRGALPATSAKTLIDGNKNVNNRNKGLSLTGAILDMASLMPAYGVSK
jgi:hypothetical protein